MNQGNGGYGGGMGGLDPNAIAADPQGFSRWNQQRQQQQGNNCDCGNMGSSGGMGGSRNGFGGMGGAGRGGFGGGGLFNQGGLASTEIRHFDEGGSSDHAGGGRRSSVDRTDPFAASLADTTPTAQAAPAISSNYQAASDNPAQFFQPIYRGQYENYANPAIANSVSSYGTGPQQSFRMPTTFNPFSTFGGQGQQFQVPQFQPMMPQYEGGIASLVNK
jgi:hypothetical protein